VTARRTLSASRPLPPPAGREALDQPSQRHQRCRQTQNCHYEKYFRLGRHLCQKLDHLPPPLQSRQRQKKNTAIASNHSKGNREKAALAICAFRFVIFITSRDPAWKTGPKRQKRLRRPTASPLAGGRGYAPDPVSQNKKEKRKTSAEKDFSFLSLSLSLSLTGAINCTAITVRKLDNGTSDARSIAAAVVGICRKYWIEWLLTLTKDGNRETAIHVRPNEAREPSTGWIEGKTHHGGPTNTS